MEFDVLSIQVNISLEWMPKTVTDGKSGNKPLPEAVLTKMLIQQVCYFAYAILQFIFFVLKCMYYVWLLQISLKHVPRGSIINKPPALV